jgi:EAL domain-containing protein (putative c-di-GMP-specific phosphodiesterase class I)
MLAGLSAPQFDKDRIVDVVTSALAETGLLPSRLELEITESLLIERPDDVLATLMRLKELGVSIAMDDFGTGYSSLSYLLKFPFDKIKIDKSFISAIDHDKAACDVLRTIGSLGKTLGQAASLGGRCLVFAGQCRPEAEVRRRVPHRGQGRLIGKDMPACLGRFVICLYG